VRLPHNIIVNADGQRFSDEGYFPDTSAALREYDVWRRRQPQPAGVSDLRQPVRGELRLCRREAGAPPPEWVMRRARLAELARKLGVSPEGLEKTAQRFQWLRARRVDRDFNRGGKKWKQAAPEAIKTGSAANRALGTIEKAPFYGIEVGAGAGGAERRTAHQPPRQVMSVREQPIGGLYAVGNAAAHWNSAWATRRHLAHVALTFGYLCVEHIKRGEGIMMNRACSTAAGVADGGRGADVSDQDGAHRLAISAGAGPDTVARLLAEKLSKGWGQQVIVEPRPGANGFIAMDVVKKSSDAHDMALADNGHIAVAPSLFKRLPYDVEKDFQPAALIYRADFLIAVAPTRLTRASAS